MAIKAILLRKKIDDAKKKLEALNVDFSAREAELEKAIEEAETDEEKQAVEEAVEALEKEQKENADAKADLEAEVTKLEGELAEVEEEPAPAAEDPAPEGGEEERKDVRPMIKREFFGMTAEQRAAFFANEDVKKFLAEVRSAIAEKRAISNVGLLIPETMLGLIRERIQESSKTIPHVDFRRINGTGRLTIMGGIPEAIWTECCAALNELDLGFAAIEVDCYKIGGYFAVCNATLEDSDINLATELINALGSAIAFGLDKAVFYGRNSSATMKMPLGIVSRLAQTAEPSGYPATARTWEDLHATNIISISAANSTDTKLFKELALKIGAASDKYAAGDLTWYMNQKTKGKIVAASIGVNAAGAIVAGVSNQMPVLGGAIETLNFIPDDVIIVGYMENYLLAERAGVTVASSEHAQFIQDNTVFKGTARYDGAPAIAEAFVAIGINGVTPDATMTFAS